MIKWEKHRNVRNTTSGGSLQTDAGTADNTETDNNTRMMLFEKKSADRFQSQAVHAVTGF